MDKVSGGGEAGFYYETPTPSESLEPGTEKQVEKGQPARQETTSSRLKQPPTAAPALPQMPQDQTVAIDDSQKTSTVATTPPITAGLAAADSNLIEKEWVEKAKQIIAKTRNDPYSQKTEVSKIKADYIQKRFNKPIKTDDTVDAVAA
ncbi:TPA: hypothetical protein DIS56_01495 [Candidatus Saccharibacteria bacterium]|nr:MAG: hypothetical protein A3F05_00245 [Candidatus Saccharibacteria bacterium RIFCSPHIGHO2_12_FULL_47_17]HCM51789.1 hypothetical protein [Candidatus Saccharibacteria bacterium]